MVLSHNRSRYAPAAAWHPWSICSYTPFGGSDQPGRARTSGMASSCDAVTHANAVASPSPHRAQSPSHCVNPQVRAEAPGFEPGWGVTPHRISSVPSRTVTQGGGSW